MSEKNKESLGEIHLEFAKNTNHRAWELLDKKGRTPGENQEMLVAAFASLYHWEQIGTTANTQRGYWMLSRVYLSLKKAADALEWAKKCLEITDAAPAEMEDFDLAFAEEGLARAYALAGDHNQARNHYERAVDLGNQIEDPEDKEIFIKDLLGGNWSQFSPG